MLRGVKATPQSYYPIASTYHLKTLEPSLENMSTAAYYPSRHMRHYSEAAHSTKHHYHDYHRHKHRQAVPEPTFNHAQRMTRKRIAPNPYYNQQDSDDSSSGCSTPPPQQQPSVRLQGLAVDKYECAKCGKKFSRPSALQTHLYTHTGERPHMCNHHDCLRTFSVKSNMRRHMKTHDPFISKKN
ncbi:hypothetical protein MBANPS3_006457 [Mucor bainieri]